MNKSMIFYEFFVKMNNADEIKKSLFSRLFLFELQLDYRCFSVVFVNASVAAKSCSPNFISANFFSFAVCKASIFTPCFLKSPKNSFDSIIVYFETDCLRDFAR